MHESQQHTQKLFDAIRVQDEDSEERQMDLDDKEMPNKHLQFHQMQMSAELPVLFKTKEKMQMRMQDKGVRRCRKCRQVTPTFHDEDGEEKRMDMDNEGAPQTSPVPSDTNVRGAASVIQDKGADKGTIRGRKGAGKGMDEGAGRSCGTRRCKGANKGVR
ncbi:hypothetical protein F4604DRAFT_1691460 [Suillus subluteus]|nr:hypothetical protein F4604DRAFT_1691460 [Suillus subluteus]